jgi:hypothetical protein
LAGKRAPHAQFPTKCWWVCWWGFSA